MTAIVASMGVVRAHDGELEVIPPSKGDGFDDVFFASWGCGKGAGRGRPRNIHDGIQVVERLCLICFKHGFAFVRGFSPPNEGESNEEDEFF